MKEHVPLPVLFYLLLLLSLGADLSQASRSSAKISKVDYLSRIENDRAAAELNPGFSTYATLGFTLHSFDRDHHPAGTVKSEAAAAYERALSFDVFAESTFTIYLNLAELREQQGDIGAAAEAVRAALEEPRLQQLVANDDRKGAFLRLGQLYRSLGDDRAMSMLGLGFAMPGPLTAHSAYLLMSLDEKEFDRVRPEGALSWSQHVREVETEVEQVGAEADVWIAMKMFALFVAKDKQARKSLRKEEVAEAWRWLERGNKMMDTVVTQNARPNEKLEETLKNFEAVKAIFSGNSLSATNDPAGRNIIFIVGLPRSGSTLVEQMLHSHSLVSALGEDTEFNAGLPGFRDSLVRAIAMDDYQRLQEVINTEAERVLARSVQSPLNVKKSKIVIDKMLFNFVNVGFIRMLFPHAKVIHTFKEDTVDAMFSLYKKQFDLGTGSWSYDWSKMQRYVEGYRKLMAHWHLQYPGFVLDFPYESLVANPEERLRVLLDHCELPWEPNVLNFADTRNRRAVLTHSSDQVRKPLYTSAIGAWKLYRDFIARHMEMSATNSLDKEL